MKPRRILAAITIIFAIPALLGSFALFLNFDLLKDGIMGTFGFNILTLALSAFAFRGVVGIIGAVGLWQGKLWGYYSAVLAWGFILVTGASSFIRFFISERTAPLFSDLGNNFLYLTLSRPVSYSILTIIFLFILLRDLFLRKGGEKKGSIADT